MTRGPAIGATRRGHKMSTRCYRALFRRLHTGCHNSDVERLWSALQSRLDDEFWSKL